MHIFRIYMCVLPSRKILDRNPHERSRMLSAQVYLEDLRWVQNTCFRQLVSHNNTFPVLGSDPDNLIATRYRTHIGIKITITTLTATTMTKATTTTITTAKTMTITIIITIIIIKITIIIIIKLTYSHGVKENGD